MKNLFLSLFFLVSLTSMAAPGDTLTVQTFSFGSKQDSTFFFPTEGKEYRKILMYYTLKCNPKQSPACGEWDYLTYTYVYKGSQRFEIARFITPYGNGLDMGKGFTWVFDVTDYMPLLVDSVRIAAGNWQELLDVKFAFIEGKPVRKPIAVYNIWDEQVPYTQPYVDEKDINLSPATGQARLKVRITGHGFGGNENCSEFCAKTHTIESETDATQHVWSRKVWRDNCSVNPLSPQGGTWAYSRANWCPGAEVETYDIDNPFSPTEWASHYAKWRYHPEDYEWNGEGTQPYYVFVAQVIIYENAAPKLDAAVADIISPSKNPMYARMNPVCSVPRIVIKNNGTDTLKTLKVTYGIPGGEMHTYNWAGLLDPSEKRTIDLAPIDYWVGANYPRFQVTVSEPNGGQDANEQDNTSYSYITTTQVLPYKIIVYLKTNNNPEQNEYTLTDAYGKELSHKKNFQANTVYRDTITLPNGCFTFHLTDAGENGLNWWAAPDEGAGVVRILDGTGKIMKSFNADFGAEVLFNFKTGWAMSVAEPDAPKELITYPNPAGTVVNIDLGSMAKEKGLLQVFTPLGQVVVSRELNTASEPIAKLDLSNMQPGMYIARFTSGSGVYTSQFIKK